MLTERDGVAVWTGHAPAGLPSGGDPLAAVRETLRLLHTPRQPTDCRRSPRAWSATSATTPCAGSSGCPTATSTTSQLPELAFLLASRPGGAGPSHRRGVAGRQRDQLRRHRRAGRRGVRRRGGPGRGDDRRCWPSRPRRRWCRPGSTRRCRSAGSARRSEFQGAVAAAVEEIKAGEAFQIVVSQRFEVDTTADALDIYRVLRLTNPSPYMYLLRLTDDEGRQFDIVGSSARRRWSPSRTARRSPTRSPAPSRGARPRPRTPPWRPNCCADPKERAEHVMLVDLGRNDLGRVCRPGTVEVVEFMEVRRYSHIMHLESTVTGQRRRGPLRPGRGAGGLPGRHLVRRAQGAGDGDHRRARGVPSRPVRRAWSATSTSPATRTRRSPSGPPCSRTAWPTSRPAAGIVADSDPPTEDQESQNKAAAVVRAVSVAQSFHRLRRPSRPPRRAVSTPAAPAVRRPGDR